MDTVELTSEGCLKVGGGTIANTYRIEPWSRGLRVYCLRREKWQPSCMWTVPVVGGTAGSASSVAFHRFIQEIPESLRSAVRPFVFGQVVMLQLAAQAPEPRDLLFGNPLLLWLVSLAIYEGRIELAQVPDYCRWRQARLLVKVCGCDAASTVNLLRKIQLDEGTLGEARLVASAITDPRVVDEIRHLPVIPVTLLTLLMASPELVGKGLVRLLLNQPDPGYTAALQYGLEVRDLLRSLKQLGRYLAIHQPHRALRDCQSLEAVRELRQDWLQRARERGVISEADVDRYAPQIRPVLSARPVPAAPSPTVQLPNELLPPALLPDSPNIIALRTITELVEEGFVQQHCVGTYKWSASAGWVSIYKVLAPQRGTLEVKMVAGRPAIGQFRLSRNRKPGKRARDAVQDWFAANVGAYGTEGGAGQRHVPGLSGNA